MSLGASESLLTMAIHFSRQKMQYTGQKDTLEVSC